MCSPKFLICASLLLSVSFNSQVNAQSQHAQVRGPVLIGNIIITGGNFTYGKNQISNNTVSQNNATVQGAVEKVLATLFALDNSLENDKPPKIPDNVTTDSTTAAAYVAPDAPHSNYRVASRTVDPTTPN